MRGPELRSPLVIAALGLASGLALATPTLPTGARAVAAAALAFALPGAALTAALLPRVALRRSERAAIALGGSLSATIGGAFLLHMLPGGLSASSWAALLGGATLAGGLVGALRLSWRPDIVPVPDPASAAAAPGLSGAAPGVVGHWLVSPWATAMLVAAGVLVALSLVIARSGVALGPTAAFTELWMLPLEGGAAVRVGVANHEGARESYRLVVTVDGRPLGAPTEVTLADSGATDAIIELPTAGKRTRTVEVRLWRADQPAGDPPDRTVRAVVTRGAAVTP